MNRFTALCLAAAVVFVPCRTRADVFTNVPEAAGYQLVYALNVPELQGSYNTTAIPYSTNNAAAYSTGSFTRVAYYMELSGSTDPTRKNGYVFVSFDRPDALLKGTSLGVPSNGPNGSKVVTNTTVANMTVVSNIQGVITGTGLTGGKLEFWPSGYVPGANGVFDYDDSSFDASSGHGSMQIHNVAAGQTLFAYNDWGGFSPGTPSEIGAGPNPGAGHPDWTFSNSGSAYTVRNIQILVKPANLVPIVNSSFDADTITGATAPVYDVRTTAPTGWSISGSPGAFGLMAPDAGEPNSYYNGPTSGYSGTNMFHFFTPAAGPPAVLSQTLTTVLKANTTYTLSMQSGNRSNGQAWGGHQIALQTSTGSLVGEWVGGNYEATPDNTFARSSRKFTTGANPPGVGQPLQIVIKQPLNQAGRYSDVDDVVLTEDAAPARPVGTLIDVLIVAGQSNTQGWQGNVNALSAGNRHYVDSPSPNALIAYKQKGYGDPVYNSGSVSQLSPLGAGFAGPWEGFGPELSMGTDLAGRVSNKVAVIKFASGGAGLNAHFKKLANDLYPQLIAQVNSGMAQLTAQGFTPTIKSFFWLQGETDTTDNTAAALYGANMTQFLSDLRTDLNAPNMKAVLTEINPNMAALQGQYATGTMLVNQGLQAAVASDPTKNKYVTTADITTGFADFIHYSADQLITVGQRWANAYQAAPPPTPGQTVFDRVPEATAEGYKVLYELDMPLDGAFRGNTAIPYTTDNSLTALPFDRVAYYMELVKADGSSQWIYVSMDPFTNVAKQLGLPHDQSNKVVHQTHVENLNIYSNVAGIETGTSLDGGAVEMWPSGYTQARGGMFYAGNGGIFDWDDGGATTDAGYGSFQVHRPLSRQVLFAYNRWAEANGSPDDVGIGNQASGNPDYTFASNAGGYTARKLVILTRPGLHATFTAVPKNHAVLPRDLTTNLANVAFTGTETEGGYSTAILRTYRNGIFLAEQTQPLIYAGIVAPFSLSRDIPAELASYDFEFLLEKAGARRLVRRITDVVAGDVYLFYGQSNTEAGKTFTPVNQSSSAYAGKWVRTFGQNADFGAATRNNLSWVPADGDASNIVVNYNPVSFVSDGGQPGAVGQWAIVIGGMIAADHNIPVALINGARGGATMPQLQKDDAQPDNLDDDSTRTRFYNRMRYRAIQGGVAAKARAMFFYQGESEFDNAQAHADGFASLHADWQDDYPGLEHIYEVQVRPGCGLVTREKVELRQAQRNFGDIYPHTSVLSTNGIPGHDGCHYQFANGYELLGLQHYFQVSRDLYGAASGPNIDALNPDYVEFTDASRTRLRLVMRNHDATIVFPSGALQDFAVTGANITGYQVQGSTILFDLDHAVDNLAKLEYRSHSGGGDFVTTSNGVGLLSFIESIGALPPVVTLLSPAMTQSGTVGDTVAISATAAAGDHGAATRMVFVVNGIPMYETTGNTLATTWQIPSAGAHVIEVFAYDSTGNSGRAAVTIFTAASSSPGGVTSGLVVWLKAETGVVKDANGYVTAWQDQSGAPDSAIQQTSANQPRYLETQLGNGPALHFDGNDFLTGNTGMPTGSYTKIVRFALDAYPPSNNLISSATVGSPSAREHALFYENSPYAHMYHGGTFLGSTIPTPLRTPTILQGAYDTITNTGTLHVDNVFGGSAVAGGDNAVSNYMLGGYNGGNNTLYGDISEVLIYDRILTPEERTAVYAYLNGKYLTPYGLWLNSNIGGNPPDGADPAGDGIPALVEYAHGLNPMANNAGSPRLLHAVRTGSQIEFSFQKAVSSSDVLVRLETSEDLSMWTEQATESTGTTGGLETRRLVIPIEPGTHPKRFARLIMSARR